MRLIIAGSRDCFPTAEEIDHWLAVAQFRTFASFGVKELVSGHANGADRAGELWAERNDIPVRKFLAEWGTFGQFAGLKRNREMAEYADAALVFWKNQSSGSANMIANMVLIRKPVYVVEAI